MADGRTRRTGTDGPALPRRGRGPRRVLLGLLVVLLLTAGGIFALSRTLALSLESARASLRDEVEALTGLPVTIDGQTSLTLLPRARLDLSGVKIGPDPDRPVLAVEAVSAELDVWQALFGRAAIERLVLVRPELHAAGLAPPRREALARAFDAMTRAMGSLERIELRDGVLRLPRPDGGTRLSNANLALSWRGTEGPMRLAGTYVWNGEPTELDMRIAAPAAFLDGQTSTVELRLEAPPLQLGFSGDSSLAGPARAQGRLTAATPSLPRAARWLGEANHPLPDLGALSVEADLSAVDRRLALRNASVVIGRSSGQGAIEMQMREDRPPVVGGTLAFDQLDVAGLARAVAPLPDNPLAWLRPLRFDFADDLDLDLRVSAGLALVGQTPVTDIAGTLKLKGGQATIDLGDATLLGGRAQARATVTPQDGRPVLDGSASLAGVDAQGLATLLDIRALGITGRADLSVSLASPFRRFADLADGGRARFTLLVRDGTLVGLDPRPFVTPGIRTLTPSPETPAFAFERLSAKLHSAGPLLSIDELAITETSGRFLASGTAAFDTGAVDISGTFEPAPSLAAAGPSDAFTSAKPSRFRMEGLWPAPTVATGPPAPQP